jgi:hypothetical protein
MALASPARAALLDDFEDLAAWRIEATEGVKAVLRAEPGVTGSALCIEFDFGSVSGYALARRELPIDFPKDFELDVAVRGDAPRNALHVRFADASGENVWWRPIAGFRPPNEWEHLRIRRRHVSFAWGPAKDHELGHTQEVQFAVAREEGGAGRVCFDRLELRERAPTPANVATPRAEATSQTGDGEARLAFDGDRRTAWRSDPATGAEQAFTVDLGAMREFGGLVLRWLPGFEAKRYDIELSEDGEEWRHERSVLEGGVGMHAIRLPDAEARFIRLRLHAGAATSYALAELEVRDLDFGASANGFIAALAREAPRGHYPRGFSGEQVYWTVVGVDGGPESALLSEDGALEPRRGVPAIEPFLLDESGLSTWADVATEHSLAAGYLPIPSVTWRRANVALQVTAFGVGSGDRSQVIARYRVENRGGAARTVRLVLAVRPYQVNPPAQFLNTAGGVAPIRSLAWDGQALALDGVPRIWAMQRPERAFVVPFDAGNLPELLASSAPVQATRVDDPVQMPSAALIFRLDLPARGAREVSIVVPLAGQPQLPPGDAADWVRAREREAATAWRAKLGRVTLEVPRAAQPLADTVRTALAHILISRNGAALQPGTRSYARTWIRDGAMMADALLRLGHADEVRAFADWYAPHIFASGKVPCCADRRGADPVPENDSHGEWIHLVDAYDRYAHDRAWLSEKWASVAGAVRYMELLREQGRGLPEAQAQRYAGLMPPSISHEGYSDRPAWSYWDDFWALAGYRGALRIASALGKNDEAREVDALRISFERDLVASIAASRERHGVDFIPGSADRGDFDPTSTTVAMSPGEGERLPRPWLDATFERYWDEFISRREGRRAWTEYTPYEIRNVGSFVRLGWRDRSTALLEFFMADRRPSAWNQWAEVVGRDPRAPRFIGDMPHAWVASDFIRAALDLFAYERTEDKAMVLAAGVPRAWLEAGFAVRGLRTPWGALSYEVRRSRGALVLAVPRDCALPPGGLVVPADLAGKEVRIARVPATIVLDAAAGNR